MLHARFVVTAPIAIMLLVAPVMGSADDPPLPGDADNQSIAVMHDGDTQEDTHSLSGKRARSSEMYETLDCFYEENKAEKDCREDKSGTR
jgi:hypothetical protein